MISTIKNSHNIESARPKPLLQSVSFFDDGEALENKAPTTPPPSPIADWETDGGNNFSQHEEFGVIHRFKSKLQATKGKIMGYLKSKATHH